MIERLMIAVVLLTVGFAVYRIAQYLTLRRASQQASTDPLLRDTREVPKVLYFTTPNCAPCKYAQRPALEEIRAELGEAIEVIQVDATEDPDAASRWQVQTVPTTFILDSAGQAQQVNHGVADARKLWQQLEAVRI